MEAPKKVVIEIDLDKVSKQKLLNVVPVENNSAVKVKIGDFQIDGKQTKDSLQTLYDQVFNRELYFLKKKHV